MELWVRSQDREKMLSNPILIVDDNKILTPKNDYRDTHLLLGHYKTKERALEVLNEIENKINLINLGHDFGSPMVDLDNPTYIYRMPEE